MRVNAYWIVIGVSDQICIKLHLTIVTKPLGVSAGKVTDG